MYFFINSMKITRVAVVTYQRWTADSNIHFLQDFGHATDLSTEIAFNWRVGLELFVSCIIAIVILKRLCYNLNYYYYIHIYA